MSNFEFAIIASVIMAFAVFSMIKISERITFFQHGHKLQTTV